MVNIFFELKKQFLDKDDLKIADKNIDLLNCKDELKIYNLSPIDKANEGDLTFFTKSLVSGDKYIEPLKKTKASYCLIKKENEKLIPDNIIPIFTEEPHITFTNLCKLLFKEKNRFPGPEICFHMNQFQAFLDLPLIRNQTPTSTRIPMPV